MRYERDIVPRIKVLVFGIYVYLCPVLDQNRREKVVGNYTDPEF